jgi:hypothetical protein
VESVKRWKKHYQTYKDVNNEPRSDPPSKISDSMMRQASCCDFNGRRAVCARCNKQQSLKQRQLLDPGIHQKTVLRAVQQDMECKAVNRRPILIDASRAAERVNFSQQ